MTDGISLDGAVAGNSVPGVAGVVARGGLAATTGLDSDRVESAFGAAFSGSGATSSATTEVGAVVATVVGVGAGAVVVVGAGVVMVAGTSGVAAGDVVGVSSFGLLLFIVSKLKDAVSLIRFSRKKTRPAILTLVLEHGGTVVSSTEAPTAVPRPSASSQALARSPWGLLPSPLGVLRCWALQAWARTSAPLGFPSLLLLGLHPVKTHHCHQD